MDGLENVFKGVAAERAARENHLGRGLTYEEGVGMSQRHVGHWLADIDRGRSNGQRFLLGLRLAVGALSFLSCAILIAWVLF